MELATATLVGRSDELRSIRNAINDRRGLFFSGPAGVGKTRLLTETKALLIEQGFDVIEIIGAQATADIPLAPLLGLVDLDQQGDLARLVLSTLTRRARDSSVAMLVDDIQSLDEASASLVHRIATSGLAVVFATHRSTDPLPSAGESLWKDSHLDRVQLAPMSRSDQESLAALMVGGLDRESESWLWETAAGHPLFLRELLVDAQANGRILTAKGLSSVERPRGVPPRLIELLGKNVHALDPQARRALELLAVGGSAPMAVITKIVGDAAVRSILKSGVAVLRENELFPAHPLFGETALMSLTDGSLKELQVTLANGLTAAGGSEVQSALLMIAADEEVDEVPLRSAFELALRSRQPEPLRQIGTALLEQSNDPMVGAQLGLAYAMMQDWESADRCFDEAVESAPPEVAEEVYLVWLQAAFEYREDPAEAMELADLVVANTDGPANQVARALQLRVRMFFEPLAPIFTDRAQMFDEDLDPRAEAIVRLDQATVAWGMLRFRTALEILQNVDLHAWDVVGSARALHVVNTSRGWAEGLAEVTPEISKLRQSYQVLGEADAEVHPITSVVLLNMATMNYAEAFNGLKEIEELSARMVDRRVKELITGCDELVLSRGPEFSRPASDYVDRADAADPSLYALAGTSLYLVASRAARRDGDDPEPLRQKALEVALWRNDVLFELFTLRDEYAFGDPATEPTIARLKEIAQIAGPGLAELYAEEGAAHLARDGHRLAELSVAAEEFGARGLAWDMAAGAQLFLRESGDGAAALLAEHRSHRLATLDPLARSPLHELIQPVLTEREVEVAELIAKGLSNPQAAEGLYLSGRTVGRHLERIYRKLGISGRGELTELLESAE